MYKWLIVKCVHGSGLDCLHIKGGMKIPNLLDVHVSNRVLRDPSQSEDLKD